MKRLWVVVAIFAILIGLEVGYSGYVGGISQEMKTLCDQIYENIETEDCSDQFEQLESIFERNEDFISMWISHDMIDRIRTSHQVARQLYEDGEIPQAKAELIALKEMIRHLQEGEKTNAENIL